MNESEKPFSFIPQRQVQAGAPKKQIPSSRAGDKHTRGRQLMRTMKWMLGLVLAGTAVVRASDLTIQAFDSPGRLVFSALANGTNYNYRVEWAPSVAGPWSAFAGAGPWLDTILPAQGSSVTSAVPMCYRVVATMGDYLAVDLSGGTNAPSYPVSYYRTLADVPDGANSDSYKTTNLLLRLIPRGTFTMGSPTNELSHISNETQHQVTLSKDFYIGIFEVTQRQWERVMGTWPSYFNNASYRDSRPVEHVNYNDIRGSSVGSNWPATNSVDTTSFMGRLRAKTGKAFDLPTEAQWEYAGRAGRTTALNSGYNLTNTLSDMHLAEVGRYWFNGGADFTKNGDTSVATAKVGSYLPSAWGLYDAHGNVWEWCLDWYGSYPGPAIDPKGAPSGSGLGRVLRGGCWESISYVCRVADRGNDIPDSSDLYAIGLRVVLPSDQ
jgi:formylglycine-generating enzyme required for sulfatase activity